MNSHPESHMMSESHLTGISAQSISQSRGEWYPDLSSKENFVLSVRDRLKSDRHQPLLNQFNRSQPSSSFTSGVHSDNHDVTDLSFDTRHNPSTSEFSQFQELYGLDLRSSSLWMLGVPSLVRAQVWRSCVQQTAQCGPECPEVLKSTDFLSFQRLVKNLKTMKFSDFPTDTSPFCTVGENHLLGEGCRVSVKDYESIVANLIEIPLDLDRTQQFYPLFSTGSSSYLDLREVLESVAVSRPKIGYVQGMSAMASVLLLYLSKSETFVLLVNLLESRYHFHDFYVMELERIESYVSSFGVILAHHLPMTWAHLKGLGVDYTPMIMEWWMTLFFRILSPQSVLRVWDLFLIDGISVLVKISVGLFQQIVSGSLESDFEEVLLSLQNRTFSLNEDDLFIYALKKVKLTSSEFVDLVDSVKERERLSSQDSDQFLVVGQDVESFVGTRVELIKTEISQGPGIITRR